MKGPSINRLAIKLEAKRSFGLNWKVCAVSALILEVVSRLLDLFQARVSPVFSAIPESALQSVDSYMNWMSSYLEKLPGIWDWRYTVVTILVSIIVFMVVTPLRFGLYEIAMKLINGSEASLRDIMQWFLSGDRIIRSIFLTVAVSLLAAFWWVVFSIPAAVILLLILKLSMAEAVAAQLLILCAALAVVGAIAAVLRSSSYIVSFFLLAENPGLTVRQALRECRKIVSGRRAEFFILLLSFIVWLILAALTYGALNVFLTPYMNLTVGYYIKAVRNLNGPPPLIEYE
ncbi:MAG: DUF975 family protein [Oscillospiraceae bacterium]|jgi:uncharacterized membrane protein